MESSFKAYALRKFYELKNMKATFEFPSRDSDLYSEYSQFLKEFKKTNAPGGKWHQQLLKTQKKNKSAAAHEEGPDTRPTSPLLGLEAVQEAGAPQNQEAGAPDDLARMLSRAVVEDYPPTDRDDN